MHAYVCIGEGPLSCRHRTSSRCQRSSTHPRHFITQGQTHHALSTHTLRPTALHTPQVIESKIADAGKGLISSIDILKDELIGEV